MDRKLRARTLTLSAAAGGTAAGIALQRSHARKVAHDPDYVALRAPLGGRPLSIASADGTQLHAEVFGPADGATVVLAHGWTEQLSLWGPVIRELVARGLRPVAYDLRGHGRSGPAVDADYSLERFGEDLEAVLAAGTPAGERATVVGHSLGAMSIAAWAEHHEVGKRAQASAMVNTGLGDLLTGHLLFGELAKRLSSLISPRIFLGSKARLPTFSSPLQHALIRYVAFGPTATAGQVAFYERMLVSCPPDVRAAAGIAISDMDLWEAVSRLTVPTLVVTGELDRLTPPSHGRRIAETLPEPAGLLELSQTGHMSPLERPQELAATLIQLVSDTAPVPGPATA
jgi:pimeloyl-ACP methyl ester carboxylesterase